MPYIIERDGDRQFEDKTFVRLADAAGHFAQLVAQDRADAFDADDHAASAALLTMYDRFVLAGSLEQRAFDETVGACRYTVRFIHDCYNCGGLVTECDCPPAPPYRED